MNVAEQLDRSAFFFPERPALSDGESEITYRSLHRLANRVAGGLTAIGVKPGDFVWLCAPNSFEWIAFYFGLLKVGAVAVTLSSSLRGDELELLLQSQTAPQETAAIFIEPVLGEGGYVVPPASFMKSLRELCTHHGIMLVADEIQSGFGRTGKWFAHQYFNIEPDIMTVAKGLASGMPISGVFSRLDLMKKWIPGSHGGTYGGNAVAAAAGVATIRAMKEDKMLENTLARGSQLVAGLSHLREEFPQMADIRGLGLMIGTEFRDAKGKPDKATAKAVVHECSNRNMLLLTAGSWDNTIRWIPPLVVSEGQINDALGIFKEALAAVIK